VNDLANDASLKAKGLHVLAIDSKEQTPTVQKFVDDNKFTFMVPLDPEGAFGKNYLVHGIPTTVIVGRNGTIKKVFIGFGPGRETEIKAAVEAALNEPKPQG
jgi:peroxiredoxin